MCFKMCSFSFFLLYHVLSLLSTSVNFAHDTTEEHQHKIIFSCWIIFSLSKTETWRVTENCKFPDHLEQLWLVEKNRVQIAALPLTSSVTWSSLLSPLSSIVFIGSKEVIVTSLQIVLKRYLRILSLWLVQSQSQETKKDMESLAWREKPLASLSPLGPVLNIAGLAHDHFQDLCLFVLASCFTPGPWYPKPFEPHLRSRGCLVL